MLDVTTTPEVITTIKVVVKPGVLVEVDTKLIPDEVYAEVLLQGLKVLLGRGMSKMTKSDIPNEAARTAEMQKKAEENYADIQAGKVKLTGAKPKKTNAKVHAEAMRLARAVVKDTIKASDGRISDYTGKEISTLATQLVNDDPSYLAMAEANLAERTEKKPTSESILSVIKSKPKYAKKAPPKKGEKASLSATQAGIPAKRAGKLPKSVHA